MVRRGSWYGFPKGLRAANRLRNTPAANEIVGRKSLWEFQVDEKGSVQRIDKLADPELLL
jgi:hypothetical protein